jgi:hypothetical protein
MALKSIRDALAGFFASLDRPLMMLVAGEDMRVRRVIARTVTRMRPAPGLNSKTRWGEPPGLAANPRVE